MKENSARNMFPVVDQNRPENQHQTVHVHMHQVCACMYPFYANYRPPLLAPHYLQPLPRPYNMQHYQYTQFNVSPFNVPLLHSGAAPISQSTTALTTPSQQQSVTPNPLDFGPPPRDRRTFESGESPSQEAVTSSTADVNKEPSTPFDDYGLPVAGLGEILQGTHEYDGHTMGVTTENFTKFLEHGCIVAEKIAIRNQHRPCFKNIQNLCNRTRGEILKPSNTVSNIHSQGIPWATKDFIYAYVRLINCWHMLKGYLESKDGTLGNIDRELTPDFKNCYITWEKSTKLLAGHMIRIFTNLDNNVSNPNASVVHKVKAAPVQEVSVAQQKAESVAVAAAVAAVTTVTQQKPKEPVAPKTKPNSVCEILENILLSESTASPPEEDSENESRVYMKPGSYNVPKKGNGNPNNDSSNSSPSIEFFDTAQNVSVHYKKIAKRKDSAVSTANNDKMWQDAQSAVPYLMNKINQPQPSETRASATNPCEDLDESALKYFVDLNTLEHHAADIQEWLNSSNFFENQNGAENNSEGPLVASSSCQERPVTVLQRSAAVKFPGIAESHSKSGFYKGGGGRLEVQSRTYRKKESPGVIGSAKTAGYRKCNASMWEYDTGGLTGTSIIVLEDIVKVLEKEGLPKWIGYGSSKDCVDHPTSLTTIRKKLNTRKYNYVNEFVYDLKNLLSCAEIYYEAHPEILQQLSYFEERLEVLLNREFSAFDFSCLGEKGEDLGPLILKPGRRSDGEGDH